MERSRGNSAPTQPPARAADNLGMIDAPFETELWIYSLSAISGLHWAQIGAGLMDAIERMARRCEIRAKA